MNWGDILNKKLYQLQQRLGKWYRPILIALLTVLLFLFGFASVKPRQYNIQPNQVADVTIRAPYTTIDEQTTNENKQRAYDAVADVYTYSPSIRENQLTLIEQYFSSIRQLRKENYSTQQIKQLFNELDDLNELANEIGTEQRTETQEVPFAQLNDAEKTIVLVNQLQKGDQSIKEFVADLDNEMQLAIAKMNDEEIIGLQTYITNTISETLMKEISAEKVNTVIENIFSQINADIIRNKNREILKSLVVQLMVPTVVFDEPATELARENAVNQVQPTYILQGQVIIQEGFVVDSEKIRLLNIYGILNNQTKVYSIYAFAAVLLIHAIFLYMVFNKWDNKQSKTVNDGNMRLTAYSLAFLFAFISLTFLQVLQQNGMSEAMLLFPAGLLPLLILPKTDRRTIALAIIFFNLISLFVLNSQTDLIGVLIPAVFYFFMMLVIWLRIEQDPTMHQMTLKSSILWSVVITVPILLAMNYEIFNYETLTTTFAMLTSAVIMHTIYILIKPYWEQLLDDKAALTLNELANLNHPLLKLLIEEAPGTYHHSILVANLSANAVDAIGGDSLFTRVASYYHDVGKVKYPMFFVENLRQGMVSPHQMMTAEESAKIIISHVTEGAKILEDNNMPKGIVDVCLQHHGTTQAGYFYHQAKQEKTDVNIEDFSYPGPKPQSKEIAVIMIADSVEAASRTLKEHSVEAITALITKIIDGKIEANQFEDSGLTVQELKIVKQSLINGVAGMFHTRVEYPE